MFECHFPTQFDNKEDQNDAHQLITEPPLMPLLSKFPKIEIYTISNFYDSFIIIPFHFIEW